MKDCHITVFRNMTALSIRRRPKSNVVSVATRRGGSVDVFTFLFFYEFFIYILIHRGFNRVNVCETVGATIIRSGLAHRFRLNVRSFNGNNFQILFLNSVSRENGGVANDIIVEFTILHAKKAGLYLTKRAVRSFDMRIYRSYAGCFSGVRLAQIHCLTAPGSGDPRLPTVAVVHILQYYWNPMLDVLSQAIEQEIRISRCVYSCCSLGRLNANGRFSRTSMKKFLCKRTIFRDIKPNPIWTDYANL